MRVDVQRLVHGQRLLLRLVLLLLLRLRANKHSGVVTLGHYNTCQPCGRGWGCFQSTAWGLGPTWPGAMAAAGTEP